MAVFTEQKLLHDKVNIVIHCGENSSLIKLAHTQLTMHIEKRNKWCSPHCIMKTLKGELAVCILKKGSP